MTVIKVDPEVTQVQSRPGTRRSLILEEIKSPEITARWSKTISNNLGTSHLLLVHMVYLD